MSVELISATFVNDHTESAPQPTQRPGSPTIDSGVPALRPRAGRGWIRRHAAAVRVERPGPLHRRRRDQPADRAGASETALRPSTLHPTVATDALATLDRPSEGRATVHVISGGSDT